MTAPVVVAGVDLSLTGLGLVALPSDWDHTWSRLGHERHGEQLTRTASEADRTARIARLAKAAVAFCRRAGATHVWIEGYPVSGRVYGLAALAELDGTVRHELATAGYSLQTAPLSTARKVVIGKLPRRDVQRILHETIRSIGAPPSWSGDEIDAWVGSELRRE